MKRLLIIILAGCLAVYALSACQTTPAEPEGDPEPAAPTVSPRVEEPSQPDDYSAVYAAISEVREMRAVLYGDLRTSAMGIMEDGGVMVEEAEMAVPQEAPAAEASDTASDSSDYSETNTQVKGIDEGDIVKTDGEYIYALRDGTLHILIADGEDTKVVSRVKIAKETDGEAGSTDKWPSEIYVSGDRLAVLSTTTEYVQPEGDIEPYYDMLYPASIKSYASVDIYDVSDRSNPRLLHELGQDGYYNTSRLLDGVLYVVSNHSVWSYDGIEEDKPETYVPALCRDGETLLVPADSIRIMPDISDTTYTFMTAYDLSGGDIVSSQSLLGRCDTVYMSKESLYLAAANYDPGTGEPYEEDNYMVTEYRTSTSTEITRYSLNGGELTYSASGSVDGYLLNQFALDEYNGYLRVVTTLDSEQYKIYEDEKYGWVNYEWGENERSNALYVLDGSLNVAGSVTGLGEDEMVYSVRFDGDYGYFVTFRQTDPLFAVDLSNPASPKVLSALKIPGFSQYLHVYGEGRLFGLGRDADEETGRAGNLKLSMFDTSDPANVTEKHTLLLDAEWSEALYNHKAILIAPNRDVIAFPAGNGYEVYGYSDETGFYKKAHIDGTDWGYDMRGLYIGDYAYIVGGEKVSVLDMVEFKGVTQISLPSA